MKELLLSLREKYQSASDEEQAKKMSAYLRDLFPFYGIPKSKRKLIDQDVIKTLKSASYDEITDLVRKMWGGIYREEQYFALDLLIKYKKLLTHNDLLFVEYLIRAQSWWDTVDILAANLVGYLVDKYPDLSVKIEEWISDENVWIRRSAIIYQLKYKTKTNQEQLFRFCRLRIQDEDFFIKKAIGWALREYAKVNPTAVRKFVSENEDGLSTLSKKEALKKLKS